MTITPSPIKTSCTLLVDLDLEAISVQADAARWENFEALLSFICSMKVSLAGVFFQAVAGQMRH